VTCIMGRWLSDGGSDRRSQRAGYEIPCPPDKGQVAAIVGAGVQAKMQLWAMATTRELSRAYVYDVSADALSAFIPEMSAKLRLEILPADSPRRCWL